MIRVQKIFQWTGSRFNGFVSDAVVSRQMHGFESSSEKIADLLEQLVQHNAHNFKFSQKIEIQKSPNMSFQEYPRDFDTLNEWHAQRLLLLMKNTDASRKYLEEYKALHSIYNSNDTSLDSVAKSLYPSFNEHFGDVYDDDQAIAYDQLTVEELHRKVPGSLDHNSDNAQKRMLLDFPWPLPLTVVLLTGRIHPVHRSTAHHEH